jgi:prophage regulatory protein
MIKHSQDTAPGRRLIKGYKELRRKTGRSRTQSWRDIRDEKHPAPIEIGPNSVAWFEDEIDEWLTSRPRRTYRATVDPKLDTADGYLQAAARTRSRSAGSGSRRRRAQVPARPQYTRREERVMASTEIAAPGAVGAPQSPAAFPCGSDNKQTGIASRSEKQPIDNLQEPLLPVDLPELSHPPSGKAKHKKKPKQHRRLQISEQFLLDFGGKKSDGKSQH